MKPFRPSPSPAGPPCVIAHRGISARAPENTMAAFSLAFRHPAIRMIELDVRLSRDGVPVVIHDRTLQRTTTGNGAVRNYTVDELRSFDAGSWFHPSFAGERIPLLLDVLREARDTCWVNIELKRDLFQREPGRFVGRVVEDVHAAGMESQVLLSSFSSDLLAAASVTQPDIPRGVIYNLYRDFGRPPSKLAGRVGATVFVCARRELRRSMIRDARQHGLALYVYTLNSIQDAKKMAEVGVAGIISDNADEIVGAL